MSSVTDGCVRTVPGTVRDVTTVRRQEEAVEPVEPVEFDGQAGAVDHGAAAPG